MICCCQPLPYSRSGISSMIASPCTASRDARDPFPGSCFLRESPDSRCSSPSPHPADLAPVLARVRALTRVPVLAQACREDCRGPLDHNSLVGSRRAASVDRNSPCRLHRYSCYPHCIPAPTGYYPSQCFFLLVRCHRESEDCWCHRRFVSWNGCRSFPLHTV